MSIDVTQYPQQKYRLTPYAWPVKTFDKPTQKPLAVPLQIDWLVYFTADGSNPANLAIAVDVASGNTAQGGVLDKIISVNIDNTNSTIPISVYFPDTKTTVSCAPQTVATLPCFTNGTNCFIIAQGLTAGFIPETQITFYNFFIPPIIDPQLQTVYPQLIGSPTIQRNSTQILTPGYGPAALGDQTQQFRLNLRLAQQFTLFGGARTSGFVYMTCVAVTFDQPSASVNGPTVTATIESTGAAGVLYSFPVFCPNGGVVNPTPLVSLSGFNLKLDATQTWLYKNPGQNLNVNNAFLSLYLNYSVNDN